MKIYKRYSLALNEEENNKLKEVKNHYKETGVKKIFIGMVNAMFSKIKDTVDETKGDGINKSGIMHNFKEDERNVIPEEE